MQVCGKLRNKLEETREKQKGFRKKNGKTFENRKKRETETVLSLETAYFFRPSFHLIITFPSKLYFNRSFGSPLSIVILI